MLLVHQAHRIGMRYGLDHNLPASRRLDRDRTIIVGDRNNCPGPDVIGEFLLFLRRGGQRQKRDNDRNSRWDLNIPTKTHNAPARKETRLAQL